MALNVLDFGAVGNGANNDQPAIQATINALPPNGGEVYIPEGNYLLNNLLVVNKDNIKIYLEEGARLFTEKYGWGILEINNVHNIVITGGKFSGPGNFLSKNYNPDILGWQNRGGGEKDYALKKGVGWGFNRNSNQTNLGTHNGGIIGNSGIGILIKNRCTNINILNVEVYGFNYSGIQVQFLGDPKEQQGIQGTGELVDSYCKSIRIEGNYIHDIYDAGISIHGVENCLIVNNSISNIGHPNALENDVEINPGYGITLRKTAYPLTHAKDITISNNNFFNCKRCSIDSHTSERIVVDSNIVNNSLICGIAIHKEGSVYSDVIVSNNLINNCGTASGGEVEAKIGILNRAVNTVIEGNVLKNSGYSFGLYNEASNTNVSSNNIFYDNINPGGTVHPRAICIIKNENENERIRNNNISNNIIKGNHIKSGIYLKSISNSIIGNNISDVLNADEELKMIDCSSVHLGKNKWTNFVHNNGNTGYMEPEELNFTFEWNGTSNPYINFINNNVHLLDTPYLVGGGQGPALVFAPGTKNPLVTNPSELVSVSMSYINKKGVDYIAIFPTDNITQNRFYCHLSPRNTSNNVIVTNSSAINGLKIYVSIKVFLQK